MSAFLNACLPMTSASGRPLRRASFTYSEPSTSSIDERVSRMWAAAKYQPSAKAGMSTCSDGARARGGQPAQVDREEQDHAAGPTQNDGMRQPEQGEDLAGAVPPAVHPHRGDDAGRDADEEREGHGGSARAAASSAAARGRARGPACGSRRSGRSRPAGGSRTKRHVLHDQRAGRGRAAVRMALEVGLAGPRLDQEHGGIAGHAHEQEDGERQQDQRDQRRSPSRRSETNRLIVRLHCFFLSVRSS